MKDIEQLIDDYHYGTYKTNLSVSIAIQSAITGTEKQILLLKEFVFDAKYGIRQDILNRICELEYIKSDLNNLLTSKTEKR